MTGSPCAVIPLEEARGLVLGVVAPLAPRAVPVPEVVAGDPRSGEPRSAAPSPNAG